MNWDKIIGDLERQGCSFGQAFRFIRKSQGISIREIATKVQKTATYISDIERGNNRAPEKRLLQQLLEALGLEETSEVSSFLFDLAACERGSVSEDIADYIMHNKELRKLIRCAKRSGKSGTMWLEIQKSLTKSSAI